VLIPALGALALAALLLHLDRAAARGAPLLEFARPGLDALLALGDGLERLAAAASPALRVPLLLALLGYWGTLRVRAGRRSVPASRSIAIAVAIGWTAQSYLLELRYFAALGLYAASIAVYLGRAAAPRDEPIGLQPPGARWIALGLWLAFLLLAFVRLDVYPELFLDEVAYLVTSRMQLGELPPGDIFPGPEWKAFSLTRFQAQPLSLLLFSLAVDLASPGVLALRMVSVSACALALAAVVAALRRRLGAPVAIAALSLCVAAPLWLAYARIGHYLSLSILHGALCFVVLMRLQERWDRVSAWLLGLLLGASLYLYQLSWFVPLLAAIVLGLSPELWTKPLARRRTATAAATALAVVLPGLLLLPQGLREMGDQSLALARWTQWGAPSADTPRVAQRLVGPARGPAEVAALRAELQSLGLRAAVASSRSGRHVLTLAGPPEIVESALSAPPLADWPPLLDTGFRASPLSDLGRLLRQLFVSPGWQQRGHLFHGGRLVDAPLVDPLVVPLLALGIAEALRRRRESLMRTLLVWVLVGGTLPAVLSGVLPRRTVLALPFLQVLMALPLGALLASLLGASRRSRLGSACVGALSALGLVVVSASGAQLYFRHWDGMTSAALEAGSKLELVRVLRGLPPDTPILLPPLYPHFEGFLRRVAEEPPPGAAPRVASVANVERDTLRRASCRQTLPFYWIHRNEPESDARFAVLEQDFTLRGEVRGAFRVLRVEARRAGACPPG